MPPQGGDNGIEQIAGHAAVLARERACPSEWLLQGRHSADDSQTESRLNMISSIHVLGSRQLGGADRFFIRLVEALARAGHPTLAVTRAGSPVAKELDPAVEQVHVPLAAKWDYYSTWRLKDLVRRRRPDVVQTYMGRATRLTRVPNDVPAVHIARLGGYYKIRGYYEHAHAWVGNTNDICRYLREQGLPPEQVFYIGNFVPAPRPVSASELEALRASLQLPADAFMVLALGRLIDKKGFDDLLQAFARLPERFGDRRPVLVIAGDGPARERLERLGQTLRLTSRLRWAGWQNDVAPYYRLADLFVCPSRHEPLGNVILEAWRHELPVVSTRNEGALELVRDGVNGLLAPCEDPAGLAATLELVLAAHPDRRAQLAENGSATVQRDHNESAVLAAYLALYEQLRVRLQPA